MYVVWSDTIAHVQLHINKQFDSLVLLAVLCPNLSQLQ